MILDALLFNDIIKLTMNKRFNRSIFILITVCLLWSCVDTKKTTYFNNAKDSYITASAEDLTSPLIQKNDILSVTISSPNPEASALFNLSNNASSNTATTAANNQTGSGYLVNEDGYIQLPILGKIMVAGSTSKTIRDKITQLLLDRKLLIEPIVAVHHLNYEVTVIGEVGKPAVINVPSEKISLLKALGLAGDITIYGKKDNVLLIREVNGKRQVKRIDLNAEGFLSSPFYYLQPNDVVYVEANQDKVATSSALKQTLPIVFSGLTLLLLALDRIIK